MAQLQGRKTFSKTIPEEAQILDLLDKDFKSTIINIFKELMENLSKNL